MQLRRRLQRRSARPNRMLVLWLRGCFQLTCSSPRRLLRCSELTVARPLPCVLWRLHRLLLLLPPLLPLLRLRLWGHYHLASARANQLLPRRRRK